jgi:alkylation response protein AidB-like acyl-CoA dehydrogenase
MKNRFGSRTFTTMIYRYAKKVVPKISQTERAALECGTIGIDKEIFNGTLNLEKLRGYNASLSDREKKYLKEVVNPLCETLDDNAIMKNQDMSPDNWNSIKKSGLLGMLIPEKYGGLNFSSHGRSKIVERIATRSGSAATSVMVPNSLGPAEQLEN